MSPDFCFVLIDLTTGATSAAMKPAQSFQSMIDAMNEQLQGPFAAAYGTQSVVFRIGLSPTDRQQNEIGINFRDTIPEAPGALAYHQVTNGVPDIEIGVDLFTDLTASQESVSSGVDHEVLETLGDAGANGWKDRQDGSGEMDASELCDFVQSTGYRASNGVWLSNFVLPSFFIPGSQGPWDNLSMMQSQFDVSNGYGIQAPTPTTTSQIGGMAMTPEENPRSPARRNRISVIGQLSDLQRRRKSHPHSRTYRRGVRL